MSAELYIVVRNWRRFQRYAERNPPWIKTYRELLHDENYLNLPGETRAILHGLWLEYAASNAQLRLNTRSLSYRLRLMVTRPQLERLEQSGWIEFLHTPRVQDVCASRAQEEVEKEKETPLPPLGEKSKARAAERPRPSVDGRTNVIAANPVTAIQAMIRNGVIRDAVDLESELDGYRIDAHLADELRTLLELQSVSNLLESEQT